VSKKGSLKLGAHIPVSRGVLSSLYKAKEWQAEVMQIFVNNPQAWKPQAFSKEEFMQVAEEAKRLEIDIYIHSIYLINLCSYNPYFLEASKTSLIDSLKKAFYLQAKGVVTHIGSYKGSNIAEAIPKAASSIKEVLEAREGAVDLILETSAGAGNIVGDDIAEIVEIFERVKSPSLKLALDSAHLFASGYALNRAEGLKALIEKIEDSLGLDKLALWHLNDTKIALGEHKDRHENIGEGLLGRETFKRILASTQFAGLPGIIETPDIDFNLKEVPSLRVLQDLRREVVNA
jgi:deoxyribonuclease-4